MSNYKITIEPISEKAKERWNGTPSEFEVEGFILSGGRKVKVEGEKERIDTVIVATGCGVGKCLIDIIDNLPEGVKLEAVREIINKQLRDIAKRQDQENAQGASVEQETTDRPAQDEPEESTPNKPDIQVSVISLGKNDMPDLLKGILGIK